MSISQFAAIKQALLGFVLKTMLSRGGISPVCLYDMMTKPTICRCEGFKPDGVKSWLVQKVFSESYFFFYHHWDCLGCEIISLYLWNMAIKRKKKKDPACISRRLTHRHSCTLFASFSDSSGGWSTLGNAFFQLQLFYQDKVLGLTLADWPGILGCPHYSRKLMDSDLRLFWGRTSVLACWTRSPWY